jgi:hypothetical protein
VPGPTTNVDLLGIAAREHKIGEEADKGTGERLGVAWIPDETPRSDRPPSNHVGQRPGVVRRSPIHGIHAAS